MKKIILIVICFVFLASCNGVQNQEVVSANISTSEMDNDSKNKILDVCSQFVEYNYLENKKDNSIISPLSAYFALSMLSAIESEDVLKEMEKAFHLKSKEYEKISILYPLFKKYFYGNEFQESTSGKLERNTEGAFLLSNSLWKGSQFFLDNTTKTKLMDVYQADIYNISDEKIISFNSLFQEYILNQMNGLQMEIPMMTMASYEAIFMNLLYLKDIWTSPLKMTKDFYSFNGDNNSQIQMLFGNYEVGVMHETDSYRTFYLDTKNDFRLNLIVPKEGYKIDDIVKKEVIKEVCQLNYTGEDKTNKVMHMTRCIFPSFEIHSEIDLNPILLKHFGLKSLYDNDTYNVTNFKQYIQLDVNQYGIEGGAASIIESFGEGSLGYKKEYHDFIVDQSFAFVITDSNQFPLFSGVIKNI